MFGLVAKKNPYGKVFDYLFGGEEKPEVKNDVIPPQNEGSSSLDNVINNNEFSDYYSNIKTPSLKTYTQHSKIGTIKELTKVPSVQPETGFSKGEKIGYIGSALGNFLSALDKSEEGRREDNSSQLLQQALGKLQSDKDRKYEAALREREYGTDIDKYNTDIDKQNKMFKQQDYENQTQAEQLNNKMLQQLFENKLGLGEAKTKGDYMNLIGMSKGEGVDSYKAPTGAQIQQLVKLYQEQNPGLLSKLTFGQLSSGGKPTIKELNDMWLQISNPRIAKLLEQYNEQ